MSHNPLVLGQPFGSSTSLSSDVTYLNSSSNLNLPSGSSVSNNHLPVIPEPSESNQTTSPGSHLTTTPQHTLEPYFSRRLNTPYAIGAPQSNTTRQNNHTGLSTELRMPSSHGGDSPTPTIYGSNPHLGEYNPQHGELDGKHDRGKGCGARNTLLLTRLK